MTRINYAVCIRGWESICRLQSQLFSKMTDFSRLDAIQAVTYTVKVVVSKKWHDLDTLLGLLHTTNRKYHHGLSIRAISNDLG